MYEDEKAGVVLEHDAYNLQSLTPKGLHEKKSHARWRIGMTMVGRDRDDRAVCPLVSQRTGCEQNRSETWNVAQSPARGVEGSTIRLPGGFTNVWQQTDVGKNRMATRSAARKAAGLPMGPKGRITQAWRRTDDCTTEDTVNRRREKQRNRRWDRLVAS